ncbi:hypothetical protein Peur_070057 [Populus x canadensis]
MLQEEASNAAESLCSAGSSNLLTCGDLVRGVELNWSKRDLQKERISDCAIVRKIVQSVHLRLAAPTILQEAKDSTKFFLTCVKSELHSHSSIRDCSDTWSQIRTKYEALTIGK